MRLNPFRRRRRSRKKTASHWLKPAAKQAVVGVILLVFSIIIILSFFAQAGRVGDALLSGLRLVFGWLAYGAPFLFIYIGYRLLRPNREPLERWRLVGVVLALVGLLGNFHLIGVPVEDALQVAHEGRGGGFLGFMLSYPLSLALSSVASLLIFIASLTIGVFMTFNISLADLISWTRFIIPSRSEEEEDDTGEPGSASASKPLFRIRGMRPNQEPDPEQLRLEEQQYQQEKQQQDLRRKQVKAANKTYHPPPIDLLDSSTRQAEGGNVEGNEKIISDTLQTFGINVVMKESKIGPTVTQYRLKPEKGIRLAQITALQNDLARALKAHPVRIEAPIPNTDLVGLEIPNKKVALVRLRDMLISKEMKNEDNPLVFSLGRDVSGSVVTADLDSMPHVLIAGATNSGKSVCIHSLLTSLLYRNSPALLRLVLIDPKRVELTAYNGIPHLWGEPVIVDTHKTLNALKWALREMDRRYKLLEEAGSRNLLSYNISHPANAQPFIVIVIDELADLMAKHAREIEGPIVRLSQLARAVGIHLVLATQRPSVDVITGLIKANFPTRIAFKVASQVDSRTILDMAGAEKLVGTGDMLYLANDIARPRRLQGGFVSEDEIRRIVDYIIANNPADDYFGDESITNSSSDGQSASSVGEGRDHSDPLLEEAKRLAMQSGKLSASLLQRRLRVGYARGARLLDILEEQGVIGAAEGNKPREVLISNANESVDQENSFNTGRTSPVNDQENQDNNKPW